MANITPAEARIGWGIYLTANGDISKDELQAQADQLNVGAISDRMFRHYRALYNAGYDHYIPINRFDILQAAEPFGNESANSRYRYAEVGAPVRVTALRDTPYTFLAVATRVSDAGLTAEIQEQTVGTSLTKGRQRLRPGDYLRIDFLEGRRASADGRLVDKPEKHPQLNSWLLEIEFSRLRSVVEFTTGEPMASEVCPILLQASDGGAVAADVLGKRLYHLLDAIENTRSLINDIADRNTVSFPNRVYPARITRVQMTSPLEVAALIPVGLVSVFGIVYSLLKVGPVAFKTVQEGRLAGAQARRERALATSVEIDNDLRGAIVKGAIERYLESEGAQLADQTETSRLFDNALEQLVGNIDALSREAVTGLELPSGAEPLMQAALQPDDAESDR